jgi:putative aldouronate transport system substrate-binding protein
VAARVALAVAARVAPATATTAGVAQGAPTPAAVAGATRAATASATRAATGALASPVAVDGRIPAPISGVPDVFLKLPPLFKSVLTVPGRGSRVTTFQQTTAATPRPKAENRYWQELEKRLGVTLELGLTPAGAYNEKIAAVTASGDLADLTWVSLLNAPSQNQAILQGAYADLTPYLTGGALEEFPHLAAFPDRLWKNATIKGKIYGVPRPLLTPGDMLVFRQDWAEKVGFAQIRNADDFFKCMVAFTKNDPDGNGRADTFGLAGCTTIGAANFNLPWFMQVFRVPHQWRRNPDGTLTNAIETEEFRQTIAFQRRLFEAGIFHPDSATLTNAQLRDTFLAGKHGGNAGSIGSLASPTGFRRQIKELTPTGEVVGLVPFGHDGGPGVAHSGLGYFGFVCLPAKAARDRERVKELLRILDFYAAPFGSEEQTFLQYGIEGVHHELEPDGSRLRNDFGEADIRDIPNLTSHPPVLYYPHQPAEALYTQGVARQMVEIGIADPTLTAYSPTQAAKAGELSQLRIDRLTAIIAGREPLSALDGFIRDWRSRGGDQIRKEYEQDLKAQ